MRILHGFSKNTLCILSQSIDVTGKHKLLIENSQLKMLMQWKCQLLVLIQ